MNKKSIPSLPPFCKAPFEPQGLNILCANYLRPVLKPEARAGKVLLPFDFAKQSLVGFEMEFKENFYIIEAIQKMVQCAQIK